VSQTHSKSSIDAGYETFCRFATKNPALNDKSLMMDQSIMNMSLYSEATTKSERTYGVSIRGVKRRVNVP
jgi:hypothetical protein